MTASRTARIALLLAELRLPAIKLVWADLVFCDLPQIPAGPMGRFMLTQMVSVAELEAGLISSRTKAALAAAKARGQRLGGFRGYVPTDDDRAASLVARRRRAQEHAADLLPVIDEITKSGITSAHGIARELTRRDIPTPRGSSTWTAVQVQRLFAGRVKTGAA